MNQSLKAEPSPGRSLDAQTAADLMTPNPVSIQDNATVQEAVDFLTGKGFSAAPVIDEAGRPVGVLSRADILVHDRQKADSLTSHPEYFQKSDLTLGSGEAQEWGTEVAGGDRAGVRDLMTPVVFAVAPDAPARQVVEDMVGWKVHRLFVVDDGGVLVGVISALDVLRHLCI